jgi:hypothetical protein
MAIVLERPVQEAVDNDVKSPYNRLLDMIAGWSEFAQQEGERDSEEAVDAICDLYQEAGAIAFKPSQSLEEAEAEIRTFLIERVLPVSCR